MLKKMFFTEFVKNTINNMLLRPHKRNWMYSGYSWKLLEVLLKLHMLGKFSNFYQLHQWWNGSALKAGRLRAARFNPLSRRSTPSEFSVVFSETRVNMG